MTLLWRIVKKVGATHPGAHQTDLEIPDVGATCVARAYDI